MFLHNFIKLSGSWNIESQRNKKKREKTNTDVATVDSKNV